MVRLAGVGTASTALLALCQLTRGALGARLDARQSNAGYTDPTQNGGAMLTRISGSNPLGEPLNLIISGQSDAGVLSAEGIAEYFESLFFSPGDCAGISAGDAQQANLGDGQGYVNQTDVLRFNYYQGDGGTCLESIMGGNHLRYWTQQSTKAVFVAASVEFPATQSHLIVPGGYDLGRDLITGNATQNGTTRSPGGYVYTTTVTQAPLLQGIDASQINHGIGVDGTVDVLTVRIQQSGQVGANRTNNGGGTTAPSAGQSSYGQSGSLLPFTVLFSSLILYISATSFV